MSISSSSSKRSNIFINSTPLSSLQRSRKKKRLNGLETRLIEDSPIKNLPAELMSKILQYLDGGNVIKALTTSKTFVPFDFIMVNGSLRKTSDAIRSFKFPLNITDKELLQFVTNYPYLKELKINYSRFLSDEGIAPLKKLTLLQNLEINECPSITAMGLINLEKLPSLKKLELTRSDFFKNKAFSPLKVLINLEDLFLCECTYLNDSGLKQLNDLPELKFLKIANCDGITDQGLVHLKKQPNLESLSISQIENFTGEGLVHLEEMSTLKHISLSELDELTDEGIMNLRRMFWLQSLDISFNDNLTADILGFLLVFPDLISLDISYNYCVDDSWAPQLIKIPSLKYLNVSGCANLTKRGLLILQSRPNLTVDYLD